MLVLKKSSHLVENCVSWQRKADPRLTRLLPFLRKEKDTVVCNAALEWQK